MRNRLYQVRELADATDLYANDVSDLPYLNVDIVDPTGNLGTINTANNYRYDELGNLIKDANEEIDLIEWTVSGKVSAVHRTSSSTRLPLSFGYGAGGQRMTKVVGDPDHLTTPTGFREHYIRDAQGNVMATYRFEKLPVTEPDPGFEASLKLTERPIYGSSRLGVDAHALELGGLSFEDPNPYLLDNPIGRVNYELTDHLGNVTTVITDELLGVDIDDNGSDPEYFQPFVVSAQGYEPFGSLLPGRHYRGVLGTDPDAMVVDEDFEGAEVVGNVVNGWNANAVAVLSMDNSSTRRLLVSDAIQYDGAQLNFATIAGESYTLTFDLDLGTTARVGVAIYAENPYGGIPPGPTWTVGGTKTVTFTATTALTRIKIYKVSNTPTTYYFIDNVTIQGPQLLLGNYRFAFNGMQKDDEVHGATGTSYDFGERLYDPRVGKWLSLDPLAIKYPGLSPYAFVGNMVIAAKDPDGRKILFINGYYSTIVGGLIGASKGGKEYWGAGFAKGAQRFFNDNARITDANYIDGSSAWGGDMSGEDRYNAGYAYAKAQLGTITADMVEGETIKMVTHSEGAAYGAGMAQYLIEQGYKVETVVHLSPDEGDEFSTPTEPVTYQLGYRGDWVTGNKPINGVDKSGEAIGRDSEGKELGPTYVHGSTKGGGVWGEVEDLKSVRVQDNIGMRGKQAATWRTQVEGTTPNGTDFHKVNGQELSNDKGYPKK